MQENLAELNYSHDVDEAVTAREIYFWTMAHTRLCHIYVNERDPKILKELNEKIETSLNQGKTLLNSFHNQHHKQNKPLIPPSGLNRFNHPKELLNMKELNNKHSNYPYKAELGTSSNLKSVPLPSRTYLKKKNNNTQ